MYASFVSSSLPPEFVAVNRTAHVPAVNVAVGFCEVLNVDQLPPPSLDRSHSQDVGVLVLASVNVTDTELVPDNGVPLNAATGGFRPSSIDQAPTRLKVCAFVSSLKMMPPAKFPVIAVSVGVSDVLPDQEPVIVDPFG